MEGGGWKKEDRGMEKGGKKVGRIIKTIEIEGQQAVTLFDSGALYTYVRSTLARDVPRIEVPTPPRVAMGGKIIEVQELRFIRGKIEGLDFVTEVVPVEELGKADGYELDALIGARTVEQWEIRLDPRSGTLDLEGLRRREFTEF